jgi:hypothetical protein
MPARCRAFINLSDENQKPLHKMTDSKSKKTKNRLSPFDKWFSGKIYRGELKSPGEEILMKANAILVDICKQLITLSTGIVGLSITLKNHDSVPNEKLLVIGWALEGFSFVFGILFLYSMVRLYINWDNADLVDRTSTYLGILQFLTFLSGLILMAMSTMQK